MGLAEESEIDRRVLLDELDQGMVHVWFAFPVQISPESLMGRASVLSADEQDRMQRFHFDRDRLHFVAAHLLIRDSLARYLDASPQALQFGSSEFGKPFLAEPMLEPPLEFNLTHTRGLVACSVSKTRVGIDAEFVDRVFDEPFAKWVMSAQELQDLQHYKDHARTERLLECWTLKEAYLKAKGVGLKQSLDSFWFERNSECYRLHFNESHPDSSQNWQFHVERTLSSNHILSIAQERAGSEASARLEMRFFNRTETLASP